MKLHALTTEQIMFTRNTGTTQRAHETWPAGTEIIVDSAEMDANLDFFHIEVVGTQGRVHTYVNFSQITPA